jgi:hypothetical protein
MESDITINVCVRLHVKYLLFLSDFNQTLIFSTDFRKILRYNVHVNLPSAIRVVPCGQADEQAGDQVGEQTG